MTTLRITSHLVALVPPALPATFTVANPDHRGPGSLRQAILDTNALAEGAPHQILFDIPGDGVQVISLSSDLPMVTRPVLIDGFSQPGAGPNTATNADTARLRILLNGVDNFSSGIGLRLNSPGHTVRGIAFTGFLDTALRISSASNVVEGCRFGITPAGEPVAVGLTGIQVTRADNRIGGAAQAARNVFGVLEQGMHLFTLSASNNVVQGNFIGFGPAGSNGPGLTAECVFVDGARFNQIGGTNSGEGNLLGGSTFGVRLGNAIGNRIEGNCIGVSFDFVAALPNRDGGVLLDAPDSSSPELLEQGQVRWLIPASTLGQTGVLRITTVSPYLPKRRAPAREGDPAGPPDTGHIITATAYASSPGDPVLTNNQASATLAVSAPVLRAERLADKFVVSFPDVGDVWLGKQPSFDPFDPSTWILVPPDSLTRTGGFFQYISTLSEERPRLDRREHHLWPHRRGPRRGAVAGRQLAGASHQSAHARRPAPGAGATTRPAGPLTEAFHPPNPIMITNHSRPCLSFCLNPSLPVALAVCLAGAWAGWAQPQPTVLTTLHGFGPPPDATRPIRPLSLGPDHALYGTTPLGGTQNFGAIFRLNRDGTGYSVLRSFSEADANGLFMPLMYAGLHVVCGRDQVLYGTSQSGSTHTGGIIFKLHTDGSGYTVLHSFDSMLPCSLIQGRDGTLYGAGVVGVFRIDPDGGNYALLRTFDTAVEGHRAMGRLWEASDGLLYGTCITGFGATNSHGTVFKLHPGGGSFEVIHTFSGSTGGRQPYAGVTEGSDGALYGATRLGGADGQGTIYKLQRDGTGFQVLHQFKNNGSDGLEPMGDLVQGLGQQLYGTTQFGGNNNQGTIYRINQDGSGYQVVHHFGVGLSPRQPVSGLITGPASDGVGVLYGASSAFGSSAVVGIIVNPPLSITPVVGNAGGQSVVFWPAWALNYQLQRTTNLTDGPWLPATNGVPVTGFQPTNTVGQEHYRLVWPH